MKIVLCCAGGLSTTMLMDAMKAGVKASPKLNESDFQFIAIPVVMPMQLFLDLKLLTNLRV